MDASLLLGGRERSQADARSRVEIGRLLSSELTALVSGIRPGHEDPVLIGLLGPDLSALVRRTAWNSLVLNPGSTSTKVSIYTGLTLMATDEVRSGLGLPDSLDERVARVVEWMETQELDLLGLNGIAARGGLMAPVGAGTYRICESMLADLSRATIQHPSNLAAPMAKTLADRIGPGVVLTTTDPVMIDEIDPVYRLTGSAAIVADGTAVHYLNHRAVAGLACRVLEHTYDELHLITCHMGGGMSAARHLGGRVVQVAPAFGTMPSANRSGALPLHHIIRLMESHDYSLSDLRNDVMRAGGLKALAGTDDFRALFDLAEKPVNPQQAEKIGLVTAFFANRVAACIHELGAAPQAPDLVVLTGGLAHSAAFCAAVGERVHLPAPVARLGGALEQSALAAGLLRACADQASLQDYVSVRDRVARAGQGHRDVMGQTLFTLPALKGEHVLYPRSMDDLIEAACSETPPIIALVGADNEEALLAVKQATERRGCESQPMARFLLLGRYSAVNQLAWELDLTIDDRNVIVIDTDDAVATAVELLEAGLADTLMKGSVSTADVLRGYLRFLKKRGLTGPGHRLSHLAFFELPGREGLVGLTDAAMNPYPDLEARIQILDNALAAMHHLGWRNPRVAVVSATEKPSAAVVSSVEARQVAEHFGQRSNLVIEGPLSVDLALSPDAAHDKHYGGRIQGDADLLLVPDIDTGNAIYKSFTLNAEADAAGALLGGHMPLILTSRGDSARTKLSSIALCVLLTLCLKSGSSEAASCTEDSP